jgi:hypothetical protein
MHREVKYFALAIAFLCYANYFCKALDASVTDKYTQITDTLGATPQNYSTDLENDFSPGLFFIAIFGFGIMFLGVGFGIALAFIVVLVISVLVSIGVLSAAVLIGLNQKSYTAGFKIFVVLGSAVGGIFLGSAGFWVLNKIMKWWTTETALLSGSFAGLIGGLLFGYTCWYVLRRLTGYFKAKLKT